jgi:hypothetical protein
MSDPPVSPAGTEWCKEEEEEEEEEETPHPGGTKLTNSTIF